MTTDPFNQNIGFTGVSMDSSQMGQAARDLTQTQSTIHSNQGTVTNFFHASPTIESIKAVFKSTANWFKNEIPETKRDYSDIAQYAEHLEKFQQIESEKLELLKMDYSRQAEADERLYQLQLEQQQLIIDRNLWEQNIIEEKLRIIKDSQAIALEEKRREIQIDTDKHYLPLQISREDTLGFLSEHSGKLIVIPSPPKIELEDGQIFKHLDTDICHSLRDTLNKYYRDELAISPISYQDILNKPIRDQQAKLVGKLIVPISTLIFHSKITPNKVLISVTITCPEGIANISENGDMADISENRRSLSQNQFDLPVWNWEDLKEKLELNGQDSRKTNQYISDLISTIHTVVAICFSDLYCLNLNPYHNPALKKFLNESEFSDILKEWTEPFQLLLSESEREVQEKLNRINELERENQSYISGYTSSNYYGYELTDFVTKYGSLIGWGVLITLVLLLSRCGQTQGTKALSGSKEQIETLKQNGLIRADVTNLRESPNGKIIDKLRNGSSITLKEVSPNSQWHRVITQDNQEGWVWADHIQY